MTTTRRAIKIGLIGNPKSDLNSSCLPTNDEVMRYFFHIFKNQNSTTNDAIEKSSWLHSKQLLKIFNSWKKFVIAEEASIMDFFHVSRQLFPQFFHTYLVPLMKNQYIFVLLEISERLSAIYGAIVPPVYLYATWME